MSTLDSSQSAPDGVHVASAVRCDGGRQREELEEASGRTSRGPWWIRDDTSYATESLV